MFGFVYQSYSSLESEEDANDNRVTSDNPLEGYASGFLSFLAKQLVYKW